MTDSGWPLQQSIYEHLVASDLMLLVAGVYDHVPEGAAFPYVTIGETTSRDWSAKTFSGQEHTMTFHVWSQTTGRRQTREILASLYAELHEKPLAVAAHDLISLRYEFSETFKDPDGVSHHGVIRFRAVTISQA